jgi:hypothetical protein
MHARMAPAQWIYGSFFWVLTWIVHASALICCLLQLYWFDILPAGAVKYTVYDKHNNKNNVEMIYM